MKRRDFLSSSLYFGMAIALRPLRAFAEMQQTESFEIEKSEEEWRIDLTPRQFHILRKNGTEAPFSSPLNREHRRGKFTCAGCGLALFSSDTKFESGTGWPSFYQPLPNAVRTRPDNSLGVERTEVHCRRCGGHLGHLFNDGPPPTSLRYCMNGDALEFTPVPKKT